MSKSAVRAAKMLLLIASICCLFGVVSALPPGIYIADGFLFGGNQYYNPVHEPHTLNDLSIDIRVSKGMQAAVSTGATVRCNSAQALCCERSFGTIV